MTISRRWAGLRLGVLLALVVFTPRGTPGAFAAAKFKVAAVGASTTLGSGSTAGHHFPDELGRLLGPDYEVKNFGLSAAGVMRKSKVSYWSSKEFTAAKALLPDVVVFWLGGSDTKPENWVNQTQFLPDMVDMIREFQNLASHPKVVVMLSVAYKDADGVSKMLVEGEVQPRQRQAAAMTGCLVVDLQAAVAGHAEFFPDGIHPNDMATLAIAKAAHPVILEAQKGGTSDAGAADAAGSDGGASADGGAGAGGGGGANPGSDAAGTGAGGAPGGSGSGNGGSGSTASGGGGSTGVGGGGGGSPGNANPGAGSGGSSGGTKPVGGQAGSGAGSGSPSSAGSSGGCSLGRGGADGSHGGLAGVALLLAGVLFGRRRVRR